MKFKAILGYALIFPCLLLGNSSLAKSPNEPASPLFVEIQVINDAPIPALRLNRCMSDIRNALIFERDCKGCNSDRGITLHPDRAEHGLIAWVDKQKGEGCRDKLEGKTLFDKFTYFFTDFSTSTPVTGSCQTSVSVSPSGIVTSSTVAGGDAASKILCNGKGVGDGSTQLIALGGDPRSEKNPLVLALYVTTSP